jgi:hypothetical protein
LVRRCRRCPAEVFTPDPRALLVTVDRSEYEEIDYLEEAFKFFAGHPLP